MTDGWDRDLRNLYFINDDHSELVPNKIPFNDLPTVLGIPEGFFCEGEIWNKFEAPIGKLSGIQLNPGCPLMLLTPLKR